MYNREFPRGGFVVVPSDTAELVTPLVGAGIPIGFYTNGAGMVSVLTESGDMLSFNCNLGSQIAMRIRRILATGTTVPAGQIYAIY